MFDNDTIDNALAQFEDHPEIDAIIRDAQNDPMSHEDYRRVKIKLLMAMLQSSIDDEWGVR